VAAAAEMIPGALAQVMASSGITDTVLTDRVNEAWARHGGSVTRQYITMLRNGQRERCSPELARTIAKTLGVKPKELYRMPHRIRYKSVSERRKRPAHNEQQGGEAA
jgi:hypothetical protein